MKKETKYFVNSQGVYIGGFSEGNSAIPSDAVEVLNPPANTLTEKWDANSGRWTIGVEQRKSILKSDLIYARKAFLKSSLEEALEYVVGGQEYPGKPKRERAKQEISDIEAATTLASLNTFSPVFE